MIATTPEEVLAGFLEPKQRILHIGGDPKLERLLDASEYVRIETADINNVLEIPTGFDVTIISDTLELVDNPVELVCKIRDSAKEIVIYEFRYDNPDWILSKDWKTPWRNQSLEWILNREFSYIHNIFLGYATVNICKMPIDKEKEERNVPK